MLVLGLVGCASEQGASSSARVGEPASPVIADATEPARSPREARLLEQAPHQSEIAVVDVVALPSSATKPRGFAILLNGDVGLSAVIRTLRISASMEPIDATGCGILPIPIVLHPSHQDAMQPVLTDETREVIVRSRGIPEPGAGSRIQASFRYGPVPSLNGEFEGWVSFHFPATSDLGSCAFDVRGAVTVVAGETTTAELPVVRIDARLRLDGG